MHDVAWRAVNAYTRRHQDAYLLEVARPWLDRVATDHPAHFVRHWQGGPHVSVRMAVTMDAFDHLAPDLVAVSRNWLRDHPIESDVVGDAVLRRLADREQHDRVVATQPPGTVTAVEDIPRRLGVFGGPAGAKLYEDYLVASTPHVLGGIALAVGRGRMALAFDALVAGPDGLFGDVSMFFLSFRSHAEGFVMSSGDPAAARGFFERCYAQRRDALVSRVRALLEGCDDPVARWARAANPRLRDFRERAARALDAGELAPVKSRYDAQLLSHSAFHETAHRTGLYRSAEDSREWQSYRLAINYLYADLARLGLSGLERFLTCYVVSQAVADAFGLDIIDELERYAADAQPL